MGQPNFGAGDLIFQPPAGAIDAAPGVVATPIRIALLQDVTLEYSAQTKELYGEKAYAAEVAFAERKLTFKAKFAKISGRMLEMVHDGATLSTGSSNIEVTENGTVASGAVTVAGSANFVANLGVYDTSGNELKQVASAPAVSQYSVSAGVYTFNASDNGKVVTIKYTKSQASGSKLIIPNPTMGIPTKFGLKLYNYYPQNNSKTFGFEFGAVVVPKLGLPFKNTDFTMPDIEGTILDDQTGSTSNIGTAYIDTL